MALFIWNLTKKLDLLVVPNVEVLVLGRRISAYYSKNNRKTFGMSLLMRGEYISKADPSCDVHSATEYLRVQSTKVLLDLEKRKLNWTKEMENAHIFLSWVEKNMATLSAFCFNKGSTDHNLHFPKSVLTFLQESREIFIAFIQEKGNKTQKDNVDFYIADPRYLDYDEWRIKARDLERSYIRWLSNERVFLDGYTQARAGLEQSNILDGELHESLLGFILRLEYKIINAEILNHFSNYMYWFIRYLYVLDNGEAPITEWQNYCTELEYIK
jgi:hypothetical protein